MDPASMQYQLPLGTDTVSQFVQHRAPELHPAWGNSIAKVNAASLAPISRSRFSQNTARITEQFRIRIEQLSRTSSNKQVKKITEKHSIKNKSTWKDIQKEAEDALNAYHSRGERNFFIKGGRAVGNKAPALQSWLQLLPNDSYTSIACGALGLFFRAAATIAKTFKQIQDAIEALTDTVDNVSSCLRLYNDDDLTSKAEELYVAILEGTEEMLTWLDRNGFKEAVKGFLQQDYYGHKIEEKVGEIQSRAESFAQKLNYLLHERIAEIRLQQVEDHNALKTIDSLLRAQFQTTAYVHANPVISITQYFEPAPMMIESQTVSGDQILTVLDVNPTTIMHDLAWATGPGQHETPDYQHRAMHLLEHPRFKQWLASENSDFLTIEDMNRERSWDSYDPPAVTHLAASLVRTVASLGIGLPLAYFCGLHTAENDPLEGGEGMMRAINSQFVEQFRGYDASFVQPGLLGQLHEPSSRVQWNLFQTLMENIRPMVIFCIVDSLSEFDNGKHGVDIPELVGAFQEMVDSLNSASQEYRAGRPILKVLITMPEMGASSASWFAEEPISVQESSANDMEYFDGNEHMMSSVQDVYGRH